ncbi:alpha/beta fold hydrolase [Microbacterium sp. X-17]|uniref:alpha/beta hydrolase family protein n=1 Tax=Microbacterium sp. X-17 TaxID=3144404 RepID=UPI0031F4B2A3
MMASRRAAAIGGPRSTLAGGIRLLLFVITAVFAAVMTALGFAALRTAKVVVTPASRRADTRIAALDTASQTITLTRTPDSELPGRYGLFTAGSESYVKLGAVLGETSDTVTRKLLTHVGSGARIAADSAFSGWYYDRPEQLHLPYTSELIGSPVGPCPGWLFPAEAAGDDANDLWCIQVHGRGAARAECLRAVPVFHGLGITTLVVSYRNDGEAPRSRTGTYGLGATEWRDVDAAIAFARRRGARRILLMGWSMGGAIALQVALNSAHRDHVVGVILDSPVVDWRVVLDYQAQLSHIPGTVRDLAIDMLGSGWGSALVGSGAPIPFDRLDVVARADELQAPMLILHSDDDGFVPSTASHALAEARPDLVELDVFEVARHTKLWNYDEERWSTRIRTWVGDHGFIAQAVDADR